MEMQELIPIDVFCRHHGIAISFIDALYEYGLIEVTKINEAEYLPVSQLGEAERLVRLHTDLEINLEGIEAVTHLLNVLNAMQAEIQALNNRLRFYEGN